MDSGKRIMCVVLVFVFLGFTGVRDVNGKFLFFGEQTEEQKAEEAEMLRVKKEAAERAKREAAEERARARREKEEANIATLSLPVDTTTRYTARELRISGNILISTAELLEEIPLVYNASAKPVTEAESIFLFDLRAVQDVILEPGQPHEISARTIQGLTQYFLSVYQAQNYAGIYVYVPTGAISEDKLRDDVLPIEILEAIVSTVSVRSYEPNQVEVEEGYLRKSAIMDWSPIKEGKVANQKALDDFVNLLNLNPDRYVSAVVTKGATPQTLSVEYDVYEANPWHWFVQVDNSGTKDRQWVPRIGVINTNLLGIDDTFTAIYQAPWEKGIEENYSIYGSYDFPLAGPKLRLNLYGGYSQFNIAGGVTDFIGNGDFYGGILRYNALQTEPDTWLLGDGWFFDIKGMLEHTRSKVKPTVWPFSVLATDVKFWLWGWGLELHRSDDMSQSSVGFDRWESWGGESDAVDFANARTGAKSDFSIYSFNANHSQFVDPNKVSRVSATFRWIGSNERLVPAKMTPFGGMYTVRGYDEYETLADGGILGSLQYEFDIVKYQESFEGPQVQQPETGEQPFVRKLAPLAFLDYGRTTVNHPTATETRHEELCSAGGGILLELGDNFSGGVYYGYPLIDTPGTRTGNGRVNVNIMYRW